VAVKLSSLLTLGVLAAILTALILYEVVQYADARERVRHGVAPSEATPTQ
jgi:hypothetical protein